jgi:alpha-tubulin suppressor-like RCC1 family protein
MLVSTTGELWTFGAGDFGQLVDGATANRRTPFRVPNVNDVVDASGGNAYTILLRAPGA